MQQESKPLFTQVSKTSFMKHIFTSLLMAVLFFGSGLNETKAQNLQFNSAVFYEYGPVSTNAANTVSIIYTGELVVGSNQVLKISSSGANAVAGSAITFSFLRINGHYIGNTNGGGEIYLPAGNYVVTFTNNAGQSGQISAFISGVLYDIVP
jgi:hypothetical protein